MSTHVHEEESATCLPLCMKRSLQCVPHVHEVERAKCPSPCMRRKVQRVYQ